MTWGDRVSGVQDKELPIANRLRLHRQTPASLDRQCTTAPGRPRPRQHQAPVESYVKSGQRLGSMKDDGRRQSLAVNCLTAFLRHDDAVKVATKDVSTG